MRETEPEQIDVRIAGTKALLNALEFVKRNFENETERNYISTVNRCTSMLKVRCTAAP